MKVPSLICLLAVLLLAAAPTIAQGTGAGKIEFSQTLIPKIPASLPLLRMTPQAPPEAFLTDVLGRMGVQKTAIRALGPASPQMKGVAQEGRVFAFWHMQTGEAEILPQLEQLKAERYTPGTNPHAATALSTARTIFARADVLPKDITQVELTPVKPLVGVTLEKGAANAMPAASLYLNYVAAHRIVQGYAVHGPGSRALVAVDNGGTVQAVSLHWRAASNSGQAQETRNTAQIYSALQAAVAPLAKEGNVQVLGVSVVYYDDNASPQVGPVYRITARISSSRAASQARSADDGLVILWAQYGNAPMPTSLTRGGPQPQTAQVNRGGLDSDIQIAPGDPTVGVYVIRNAEAAWLASAQGFISGLNAWSAGGSFTLAQYYWAQHFMYYPNASSWVDSVQIAETEGHGTWWNFTTNDQNWTTDNVNFDTFPNSGAGYGPANHGKLNYWLFHGCEEIPSPEDAPCPAGSPNPDHRSWTDPWWRIFQGLHVVVGYRTVMWIADDVEQPFAQSIKNGTPVIAAWFNTLEPAAAYNPDANYVNNCGLNWPMGRPAAVAVCGHGNDTLFDQQSIGPASCLTIYWEPN